MDGIPQEFQNRLIKFLSSILYLQESQDNRTTLLAGIPSAGYITRVAAPAADLRTIVGFASASARLTKGPFKGKHPLQIVIEQAREYVKETEGEEEIDKLLKEFEELIVPDVDLVEDFFVNRVDEINTITSPPAYYLVDAPAGYGKTQLLQKLQRLFTNANWRCAYAAIYKGTMMLSVAKALASELKVDIASSTSGSYGARLGNAINKNNILKQGILLLIDFEGEPEITVFNQLMQHFISDIQRVLAENSNSPFVFRVVIAGRHLATTEEYKKTKLPFTVVTLTPFDYSVVRDFLRDCAGEEVSDVQINDIAAHLTYLTGGHPGCISDISKIYNKSNWQLNNLINPIYDQQVSITIDNTIRNICEGLPFSEDWHDFIVNLSVFRYIDYALLANLQSSYSFAQEPKSKLADILTESYLFSRQGRWIKNNITRRLLALWLRHNLEEFKKMCENAMELCFKRLQKSKRHEPEVWVTEYWFQYLQASTGIIQDIEKRAMVRTVFWNENFPHIMYEYFEPDDLDDDVKQEKERLLKRIREDWEFQFTLNYYLREDHYTELPYQKLLQSIEAFDPTMNR
ncbi:MAG: hypothetical protein JXA21_07480 [Anaerolineae bacterium]|nr:hypothetical protein [Anaerolineae bacterium]